MGEIWCDFFLDEKMGVRFRVYDPKRLGVDMVVDTEFSHDQNKLKEKKKKKKEAKSHECTNGQSQL